MIKDENKNIKYKSEFIEEIKYEILAFLNIEGGTIYVDVNNDKTINDQYLKLSRKEIETIISPSIFWLIDYTFAENGILIINVSEGYKNHII